MCFTIDRLLVKPLKIDRIEKNENFNPIILYYTSNKSQKHL